MVWRAASLWRNSFSFAAVMSLTRVARTEAQGTMDALAPEVLAVVLSKLDSASLGSAAQVCHMWADCQRDQPELWRRHALAHCKANGGLALEMLGAGWKSRFRALVSGAAAAVEEPTMAP
eukprot:3410571-Prymnesium_polylepis.1